MGDSKNVGGYDSVGITYYNTSGTCNATVKKSLGYWHDGGDSSMQSSSPSHGGGRLGVAFDYQDKVTVTSVNFLTGAYSYKYLGAGFAATITYDSKFVNWNGKARTFNAHTWNTTDISSIGFNGGGGTGGATFGVDIAFSSTSNSFKAFNSADTSF